MYVRYRLVAEKQASELKRVPFCHYRGFYRHKKSNTRQDSIKN